MIPDGATEFKGKTNQDVTVTFDNEGVYGVKCPPHYGMGIVALIIVGQPVNIDEASRSSRLARQRPSSASSSEAAN